MKSLENETREIQKAEEKENEREREKEREREGI